MNNQNQICCPRFDPAPWDGKILEWDNKKFIKGKVFTLFFMPLNFGQVITKLMAMVEKAGAKTPDNLGTFRPHLQMEYGYLSGGGQRDARRR